MWDRHSKYKGNMLNVAGLVIPDHLCTIVHCIRSPVIGSGCSTGFTGDLGTRSHRSGLRGGWGIWYSEPDLSRGSLVWVLLLFKCYEWFFGKQLRAMSCELRAEMHVCFVGTSTLLQKTNAAYLRQEKHVCFDCLTKELFWVFARGAIYVHPAIATGFCFAAVIDERLWWASHQALDSGPYAAGNERQVLAETCNCL